MSKQQASATYRITSKRRGNLRLVQIHYPSGTVDWWTAGDDQYVADKVTKLRRRLDERDNPKWQIHEDIV